MKIYLIAFAILFLNFSPFAQRNLDSLRKKDLVGLWQINSKIVGSGYDKTFQFYDDGKFRLNYSSFDDNKCVTAVIGHYRITNGKLYMIIDYREEITGGKMVKGSPAFQREEFVLEGGTIVRIKQNDTTTVNDPFAIRNVKRDQTGKIISLKISFNQYYKLSDNPRVKEIGVRIDVGRDKR